MVFKEANKIIVPSKTTQKDILDLGIDGKKLAIIPEAIDPEFKKAKKNKINEVKRKHRIFGKYLLSVGVGRRKNTARIIEAFEKVKALVNLRLVIIGHQLVGRVFSMR